MSNENRGFTEKSHQNEENARKAYSTAGIACFATLAVGYVVKFVIKRLFPSLASYTWGTWFLSFAPLYLVGVPVTVLIFLRVPAHSGVDGKGGTASLELGQIVRAAFIGIFLLRVGSVVGDRVTGVIQALIGISKESKLDTLLRSNDLLIVKILITAIAGPLIEELIYRKLLIDRIRCYGGKLAVVTSGLMFGLFHGNFSQFFYAFAVGILFAYIYLKTGKYRYSAALHILINSIGVLEATAFLSVSGLLTDIENASGGELALIFVWALVEVGAVIIGLVLFCRSWRKATYEPASMELPKGSKIRVAYLNVGMLVFVVFCAVLFVRSFLV
ncbi:MAG: CPBP family intramembrane metalloprotease [Lachnospiraceae bacterium]|nr:CPBP family intramembrane metalloprotease [Lachnospiraceae bacterium]